MNTPHEYVEQMVEIHASLRENGKKIWGDPTPVYEFLTKHGMEFQGTHKPKKFAWRRENHCFHNAWRLALASAHLVYCEGYASTGIFPLHHAWCVDERDGSVVETTWRPETFNSDEYRDPTTWEYFGVPLNVRLLRRWMQQKPTASVLFDFMYHEDFIIPFLTAEEIIAKVGA